MGTRNAMMNLRSGRTKGAEISVIGQLRRRLARALLACASTGVALPLHAAQVCALPGSAGNVAISGTVNTYYAAQAGSYGPGSSSIPIDVGSQQGAAAVITRRP